MGTRISTFGGASSLIDSGCGRGGESAKRLNGTQALLQWVKNCTVGFNQIDIKNFTKSWHSGTFKK
jgi:hypothetical protein